MPPRPARTTPASSSSGVAALAESMRDAFPRGVGQPALRALAARRLLTMEQLTTVTETELLAMHGMGPKAVRILRDAMQLRGLSLRPPR
jgi:hypothetical protein